MKRSGFFQQIALGTFGATVLPKQVLASFLEPGIRFDYLYIGSYTSTPQEGISLCLFDPANGEIRLSDTCQNIDNPSFIIFDSSRNFLYAANETAGFDGNSSGSVSAFHRDQSTGKLLFLNSVPSLGANPCHLTIDRTGRFVLVSNYSGGNVSVIPILADGRLGNPVEKVQHSGKGPHVIRQEAAHVHSVNLSPDNRFALVCDLGLDKIMIYRFDQNTGKLSPAAIPFFQTAPASGPRHFTFTRDGRNAFVVNELNSTISYLRYDPDAGVLTELHTLSTLPDDFTGENTCADVHLSHDNRFVYASNRGHDSIAVFSINQGAEKMKLIQHQPTLGKTPRNFVIHPSGKFLLAANQNSNSIRIFDVNPDTGMMSNTGKSIEISKPVCLLF